jgi:hypothetical protein
MFICDLFNDVVSSSDYTAPNDRMIKNVDLQNKSNLYGLQAPRENPNLEDPTDIGIHSQVFLTTIHKHFVWLLSYK